MHHQLFSASYHGLCFLASHPQADHSDEHSCFFLVLKEKIVYKLKNMFLGFVKPRCVGSSYGSLFVFDEEDKQLWLLNHSSRAQIGLPSTKSLSNNGVPMEKVTIYKAILLPNPCRRRSFIVVVIYKVCRMFPCDRLAYCSLVYRGLEAPLTSEWTNMAASDEFANYDNIICHNGLLYALNFTHVVWDFK